MTALDARDRAELARALFAPRAVALVGASSDPSKNTGRPQRFLKQHGYRGRVFPINPRRDEVQGVPAFARVSDVPEPVDHALVMVPRDRVAAAVEDCGRRGVPVATVYSDGFADLGTADGIARQRALLETARAAGVRLLGPNSMGVLGFHAGATLSVNAILEMPAIVAGAVSVVSQSGSVLGSLLSRGTARGVAFSKMVSVGNEADLDVGEILELLVDDAETESIALFLESLRGARRLAEAARRAHAAGKPVVAYKLGRSDLGRRLAATHSGAMTGDAAVADAFFKRHGIAQVRHFEALFEALPLLGAGAAERARRVSVMTTTGGGAATVVDRLGEVGIATVPAGEALAGWLAGQGIDVAGKAIVDLTMAGARRATFEHALRALLDDPRGEAVLVVVGSSAQFHPHLTVDPIVACARAARPLAVFIVPEAPRSLRLLLDADIAAFRTPEACADAIRALIEWRPPGETPRAEGVDLERVRRTLTEGAAHGFDEARAARVLEALGVPLAPFAIIDEADAAPGVPFPVALKLLSTTLTHKTEHGGVALEIADLPSLRAALDGMRSRLAADGVAAEVSGFLVQSMQRGLAEAVVAYRRDPEVGPLVSVGLGGRLTEIYRDLALRPAPIDVEEARQMIEEVKGLATIRGYRGLPAGDVEALARALVAVSQLARVDAPRVAEAEINPLLVRAEGDGVVALDAVLALEADQ